MHTAPRTIITAALGLVLLTPPVLAHEDLSLGGLWRLRAFYAEDVVTKRRTHIYGESPIGFMSIGFGGRFDAWAMSGWPYRDGLQIPTVGYRAIFYAGQYRLQPDKIVVRVDQAQHEGFYSDPIHVMWNEFQSRIEETRSFRLERDELGDETLSITTMHMPEPNGTGDLIIGTAVWVRSHEWDETPPR